MSEFKKCDDSGPCKFLSDRLGDFGQKGFRNVITLDMSSDADEIPSQWRGVTYHMTTKDRGALINYCPWCGGTPGDMARKNVEAMNKRKGSMKAEKRITASVKSGLGHDGKMSGLKITVSHNGNERFYCHIWDSNNSDTAFFTKKLRQTADNIDRFVNESDTKRPELHTGAQEHNTASVIRK